MEEIPPGEHPEFDVETGETSEFDLDLQRADDAATVDQILKEAGIPNVIYRFYDNDGGYCYSSPDLDYDRARRETKGGKSCKLGVFVGGKIIRMVPFPLAPIDPSTPVPLQASNTGWDNAFMKELLLKLVEKGNSQPVSGPSLAELTTALKNMDELRGKQESTMDIFMKGMDFAQSASGQTDWKTDLIRTGKDLIPQVLNTINGFKGGGMPVPIEGSPQQPEMPPEAIIKAGIQYLKKKYHSGVEPELIIDWIRFNGEEYESLLRVVLNSEFSDFVKYDPEIGAEPYAPWFKCLFDGLRSAFAEQNSVDNDSGGSVGDASDIGSNGKPREKGSPKPKD